MGTSIYQHHQCLIVDTPMQSIFHHSPIHGVSTRFPPSSSIHGVLDRFISSSPIHGVSAMFIFLLSIHHVSTSFLSFPRMQSVCWQVSLFYRRCANKICRPLIDTEHIDHDLLSLSVRRLHLKTSPKSLQLKSFSLRPLIRFL
jgi:hypothetical protein